ncbi:MAG: hypothetical protein VX938_08255 [Myxococcota bacterium]|nr:hypothetical protein [Myxococcota bacterium]
MLRRVSGILMGLVAAGFVVWAIESVGHLFFPFPEGMEPGDPMAIAAHLDALPVLALLVRPVAWCLGTLCGVWLAIRLVGGDRIFNAVGVGGLMGLMGVVMFVQIPTPAWLVLPGLVSFPLGAFVGVRLSGSGE